MPVVKVLFDIPQYIQDGLNSGKYIRESPGIIRWAAGSGKKGIVMHLRESSATFAHSISETTLIAGSAVMLVQIAGFAYLGYQISKVNSAIKSLHKDVEMIVRGIEQIQKNQWSDKLKSIHHGIEFFRDSKVNDQLLDDAQKYFREGRGEIGKFLNSQEPPLFLKFLPEIKLIALDLTTACICEYYIIQNKKNTSKITTEVEMVFDRYCEILQIIKNKFQEIPPKRIPSLAEMQNMRDVRPFLKKLDKTIDYFEGEKDFVKTLGLIELDKIKVENQELSRLNLYIQEENVYI